MKKFATAVGLLTTVLFLFIATNAQAPAVEKVEPPSWWVGSTISPVRILIRGTNFTGAKADSSDPGVKISNLKVSTNGHYLFIDVTIAENVRPGSYPIRITTAAGTVAAPFSIFTPAPRLGNYQGFLPDDVIYFLMPDRFADGDPSNNDPARSKGLYDRSKTRRYHGGDLQGVIDKLAYIKSLGATAVWTTPLYDNNDKLDTKEVYDGEPTTGYHGYGAVDFYGVEEHFGDMAKVQEFVRKAHAAGLLAIQDQVANHTGPYHVWANDPPTPTWFNGTVDKHISNNWQKWTTMNPRATYQTQARNLDGWFVDILPDLNQNDPEVEKYLIQNSLWWLAQTGFDAIRMDTLPHVPRTFWAKWSGAIHHEFPKVNILGELFDGDPALVSYFQKGRRGTDGIDTGIDTLFDFSLYYAIRNAFAQGKPIREVSQIFAHDWLYPKPDVLTNFIGNHDVGRFMGEKGATIEGLKLADTLMMTSRGTPIIYYGDEIAMPGGGDPDNRRDFPGGFPGDPRNAFTSAGRTSAENDAFNYLARLGELRRELEPLRRGQTLDLVDEEQQMVYARYKWPLKFAERTSPVIIAINNDTKSATLEFEVTRNGLLGKDGTIDHFTWANPQGIDRLWLDEGDRMTDKLENVGDVVIKNGRIRIELPARSAAILTRK